MNRYLYTSLFAAAIVSFVISTTICPFGKKLLKKTPRSSLSNSDFRQMHDHFIPRIGGLGIFAGFWITISLILVLETGLGTTHFFNDSRLASIYWIAVLSIAAFLLGFLDDIYDIRARYKLLLQLIIAIITVMLVLPLQTIFVPFIGEIKLGPLGYIIGIAWIVGVMNAINLIDGLDSLAGGIALIAMVAVAIQSWFTQDMMFFTLALTLISSIAGFLIYNFYPATVFMGDGGALFLGYLLAVLPLLQIKTTLNSWSIAPIFLLGVPLVDTLFSMLRRFIRGIPMFSADRNHIHHKLIAKGLSHRQAVRRLHLVSILYALIFLLCLQYYIPIKLGLIIFGGVSWLLVFFAGYEEFNKPISVIKNRFNYIEDRSFIFSFSQNIDIFFKRSSTLEEILFILSIWTHQFEAVSYKIRSGEKLITKHNLDPSCAPSELTTLAFEKNAIKIELTFFKSFFELDSDVKLKNINHVMNLALLFISNPVLSKDIRSRN